MKKSIIALFLLLPAMQLCGQEIYNKHYTSAHAVINNPESPDHQVKLNHFYVTELNYLKSMAEKEMGTVTTTFLDTQAFYLTEFVGAFFKDLSQARLVSNDCQQKVVMAYVQSSLDNPLFKDADEEKTLSFMNDPQYLTPFSLNTDWEKAFNEAKKKTSRILKK